MEFSGINYLAVGAALIASMVIGAIWYGVFGKPWMAAIGMAEDPPKQEPSLYVIAIIAQAIMAWMLAGIIGHLGMMSIKGGLITALFCWLGFIVTSITVNHRFQGANWNLTFINCGHWLAVLLVQGAIIGAFGV